MQIPGYQKGLYIYFLVCRPDVRHSALEAVPMGERIDFGRLIHFSRDLRLFLKKIKYLMKQTKEDFKRFVKYWRVAYKQANSEDRLSLGMFGLLMLVCTWWVILVA